MLFNTLTAFFEEMISGIGSLEEGKKKGRTFGLHFVLEIFRFRLRNAVV